jgi:hypothetical protein
MNLPLTIRSLYYKGLLVLLKRDRLIDSRERDLMLQLGVLLDFDRRFCEATIDSLLVNVHINRKPIIFSDETIKECFFRDAMRVALADGSFDPKESRWLRKLAYYNGLTDQWLDTIIREFEEKKPLDNNAPFEIQKHL